jgi:hypothetical protein
VCPDLKKKTLEAYDIKSNCNGYRIQDVKPADISRIEKGNI